MKTHFTTLLLFVLFSSLRRQTFRIKFVHRFVIRITAFVRVTVSVFGDFYRFNQIQELDSRDNRLGTV